jgi:formylglycine-generating enzyme required for sulfatase activity
VYRFQTAQLQAGQPVYSMGTAEGFPEPLRSQGPTTSGVDPCLTLLHIPAGSFLMGSPPDEEGHFDDEGPQHTVHLDDFFLSQTPVTQAQWRAVAQWVPHPEEDPWQRSLDQDPVAKLEDAEHFHGDKRPVVNVSWYEAMEFCRRLQVRTGKQYALPSEAQWEYACRVATITPFHFGDTLSTEVANYNGEAVYGDGMKGVYRGQTTDVAQFPANDWGLHDMHGNVWEWCADHWHPTYDGAPADGKPWLKRKTHDKKIRARLIDKQRRLLRGGSWYGSPKNSRSAYRSDVPPDFRGDRAGFRVCCLHQDFFNYS